MSLKNLITKEILKSGPITIAQFMEYCLYHENYGYYASKKNTIGADGDFITSPEISQVFGELIGIWLAQTWIDRGKPKNFSLVELGPGNGIMMRDILHAIKKIPGCLDAASIVLVEKSQILRSRQKNLLIHYSPSWIESVDDIPEKPFFLVANEFLDALPIRQFKKENDFWYERSVGLTDTGELKFINIPSNLNIELNYLYRHIPNNVIAETSDITKNILSRIFEKIARNSGVCLFIDYGYLEGQGETLQAVHKHSYANPLDNLGESDLTAQVNFKNIYNLILRKGLRASNFENQRNFLTGLGIKNRSEILTKNMSKVQKKDHLKVIDRFIGPNQMGNLFKVMGVTNRGSPKLPILEQ